MAEDQSAIAIIGMAARLPGASSLEQFWENIQNRIESISRFSDIELIESGVPSKLMADSRYVKARGILPDIERFDAAFFGFTPLDAALTDPQHRLLMECAWEALESAGCVPERYPGAIGIYTGTALSTYWLWLLSSRPQLWQSIGALRMLIGNDKDHVNTKISYKLNLTGPSLNINTECSSSLVAVHVACQGLLSYDCDVALAGGVCVTVPQTAGYLFEDGAINSNDGHCRAFDAGASGTVPGNGAGLVLLKRLSDALADGDSICAVIRGSAINNDGNSKVGYTAPSVHGQATVITKALVVAGVDPSQVDYIEAHGTGTSLGDPIEIRALERAFATRKKRTGKCRIGTIKPNIGHLGAAAGIAGLIATVLAMKHKRFPPLLHFKRLNPNIELAGTPFLISGDASEWASSDHPRIAGVSSFGIGGTNAHVILEEAPQREVELQNDASVILPLSAQTPTALDQMEQELAAYLGTHPELRLVDVARTLQYGRNEFKHRSAIICSNVDEAITALKNRKTRRLSEPIESACIDQAHNCRKDESKNGIRDLLQVAAREWESGRDVGWDKLCLSKPAYLVHLPTYPFERQRYWTQMLGLSTFASGVNPNSTPHIANSSDNSLRAGSGNISLDRPEAQLSPVATNSEINSSSPRARRWIEKAVCEIWREVLGVDNIHVTDNFFDLGGDSLLILQIVPRFRQRFQIDLPISVFFESPTIEQIVAIISRMLFDATTETEIEAALAEVSQSCDERLQSDITSVNSDRKGEVNPNE